MTKLYYGPVTASYIQQVLNENEENIFHVNEIIFSSEEHTLTIPSHKIVISALPIHNYTTVTLEITLKPQTTLVLGEELITYTNPSTQDIGYIFLPELGVIEDYYNDDSE